MDVKAATLFLPIDRASAPAIAQGCDRRTRERPGCIPSRADQAEIRDSWTRPIVAPSGSFVEQQGKLPVINALAKRDSASTAVFASDPAMAERQRTRSTDRSSTSAFRPPPR